MAVIALVVNQFVIVLGAEGLVTRLVPRRRVEHASGVHHAAGHRLGWLLTAATFLVAPLADELFGDGAPESCSFSP